MNRRLWILLLGLSAGCGSNNAPSPVEDTGVVEDAAVDSAADTPKIDKSTTCASEFGTALTNSFGRADGTVTAIVGPTVTTCAMPNNDHVVVQIKINGAIYRMVINVQSSFGTDLRVRFASIQHAAVGDPWSEGWHPGVALDYPSMLDMHVGNPAFVPYDMLPLADKIESEIDLGAKVSVYSWSSGGGSAHKVHRNGGNSDGAIVVDPSGANPKWLLFHFENQTF
jgi:hypothetical protein